MKANLKQQSKRTEITFEVEGDEQSGWLTASWDAPRGQGGITTQGKDLRELEANVREAVRCHFENGKLPRQIRLHFVNDPVLATA
jgi:predicted RNase H-like HicB family nuclease